MPPREPHQHGRAPVTAAAAPHLPLPIPEPRGANAWIPAAVKV
jgi:hypothetical protein